MPSFVDAASHSSAPPGAGVFGVCAKCGKQAPLSRAYCGGCGSRLWEPCLDCEMLNSVAEQFCTRCGTDVFKQLAAAQQAIDEKLARAAELEKEGKLLEAVDALAEVPETSHSQMASRIAAMKSRRTELVTKRENAINNRGQMLEDARRLQQDNKYAAAFAVLEQIPASLRDQATRSMLAELERPLTEIKQCRAALVKALKTSQPETALPQAERLVQLEPHVEDIQRVCVQLRERKQKRDSILAKQLLAEARDAIAKNDYATAGAALDQMPPTSDENDLKLLAAIEERVWIVRQLKAAPYADETLRGIAARLAKLQPKDKNAAKVELDITARLARAENRGGRPFVPWLRAAEGSRLGPPVEPISNVAKLHWAAKDPQLASWTMNLRRHLVGVGLALAGLDAATLDLELNWREGRSLLGRLTGLGKRRASTAWGLDFGTSGLKFVRLSRSADVIAIDRAGIIPFEQAPPAGQGGESANLQQYLAPIFEKFRAEQSPGDDRAVIALPGAQSLGRFFNMPQMNAKKLSAAVEFEVGNQIPLPAGEVVHASHIWQPPVCVAAPAGPRVFLVAAKKSHALLRVGVIDDKFLRNCSLQSECVALLNVLFHSHADHIGQLKSNEAIALIEVGDVCTNIVSISPATGPWFRTVHRGIRFLNKALVDALGITWQQAQQLRQKWPGSQPMAAVDKILIPAIEELTREIRRAVVACEETTAARISRIYVAGGGCDQFGLLRHWCQNTNQEGISES